MNFLIKNIAYFSLGLLVFTTSCEDSENVEPTEGKLTIQLNHKVDGQNLAYDTVKYVTANNDTFTVNEFKYYISNVKLIKSVNSADNQVYTEADSYHFIDPKAGRTSFTLNAVPLSSYNKMELAIGVDSNANTSTDNKGDLDPSNEMAWDWDTGYIFLKAEGRFKKTDGTEGGFRFHPGGNASYRTIQLDLPVPVVVGSTETYTLNLTANIAEIFKNPNSIDLKQLNNIMHGPNVTILADNYASGFITPGSISK